MSLKLLTSFVCTIRQTLPRHTITRSGLQIRTVTGMDATTQTQPKNVIEIDAATQTEVRDKKFTRYMQRNKRQWEDENKDKREDGETDGKKPCDPTFERIKKKKMAMLLGYCGVDYYGMQRNPGVRTIEEDLLKALFEAKYISEEDFNNQQNAQFQRSSRTDKGVSAARQVVSLKLPLEIDIEEINKRLPENIKVFGVKRVTNKFNSKIKCNARTYSYTLPTYVFEPTLVGDKEKQLYRITEDKLKAVNDVLAVYIGTKSYHNFTEKKHYQDPSASRYMMSFTLDRVFVDSDWEFAELLVKGQSFMLHQIRKMVGLMIAIVRGHTDISILEKAFGKDKVMIPTAPGLGLVLDKVHYERYDAKFKDSHDSLTWEAEEELVQTFKKEKINPNIVKGEIEDNSMGFWLEKLSKHNYEPSEDVPVEKEMENEQESDDDDDKENVDEVDKENGEIDMKNGDESKEQNGHEVDKDSDEVVMNVDEVKDDDKIIVNNGKN
ncbi:PREDICTED: tRNA pseudouridine synthase A, mitochondrial-like isoform X1 [Papilio xuthus]|uniref:Pseudouridylate synthase 1 homolog n=2 Tax=Papilio xuthus TaxID=66420 RepID=A0AAJ6ZIL8_PAPXU|nr:PREDICTED: tRNA pseudouridine synthase A, mitochondrial-like isoform X1 [Papilio xuthus]